MRTLIIAALLAVAGQAFAGPVPPSGCPTCIQNTASPQEAQINIGTATIRGTMTVSTLNVTNMAITNLTATNLIGGGAGITGINASALASGTVPSARLSGAYTGITSVGTIAAGTWQGTIIAPQYGGTGKNWSTVGQGALPIFDGTGTMSTLPAGTANSVLQTNGAGANPSWTAAPTVLGTNVTAIPMANLQTGNLPSAIKATDASLVSVSGSKVAGDIGGNAANITGTLPVGQVGNGTLGVGVIAQTLNHPGGAAGTFGGPLLSAQITTNLEGRITSVSQFTIPGVSTRTAWIDQDNYWHGPGQTSLSSWTWLNGGRIEGTLSLDNALAVTSGGTGRASLTANALIYGAGTAAPVSLPVLGNGGLIIGTGGAPSTGTITGTANQVTVTNGAGMIALSLPQDIAAASSPSFASLTLAAPLAVGSGGTGKATLTAHGVVLGQGTAAVTVLPAMGATGLVIGTSASVDPSTGTLSGTANRVTVTQTGTGLVLSGPQDLAAGSSPTFAALTLTAPLTTANGGSGNDWSATAAGGIPYFSGTGALSVLAKSVNGYTLTQVGGVPAWAAASSSATNIVGGAANSVPYQTAPNATAFLAQGSGVMQEAAGAPDWTLTPTLTGTNFSGIPPGAILSGGLGNGVIVSTNNFASGFNGASELVQLNGSGNLPALNAAALTSLTAANISAGTAGINISGNAATVTTNANLTGNVTSIGNATTLASIPAISGAALTHLTAANIDAGTAGIDISGNAATATSATKATNLAGGLIGQTPYQTAANTTAFLPAKGALGIEVGNGTGAVPSTATLQGTASQVTVTQTATAVTLSLPATINVNTSGTSALATAIAGGLIGQIPYQTAAGVTSFLPSMGAAGIIIGNGSGVVPSTATLTGTTNRITVTQSGTAVTLTTPQDIQSGAAPTFAVTNFTGTGASMTSGAATNIAGGGLGQHPYQTASGATSFLPAMGAIGIIVGNGTGVVPSTATLQGTASQVTVTQTGTAVTLSLPATINVNTSGLAATASALASLPTTCSAGNYPLGILANGNATGCTAAGAGTISGSGTIGFDGIFTAATTIAKGVFSETASSATLLGGTTLQFNNSAYLYSAPGSTVAFAGAVDLTSATFLGGPLTHGTTQFYSTTTWTTPAGVQFVNICETAAGASGGSGGGTVGSGSAGGGGAGETVCAWNVPVTPGAVNSINMGINGSTVAFQAGANGLNGISGGDLTFANAITSVTAKGGQGGFANSGNTAGAGGAGGGPTGVGAVGGTSGTGNGVAGTSAYIVTIASGPILHIGGASGGGGGNNANGGIGGPSTYAGGYLGGTDSNAGGAAYAGGGGGGGGGLTGIGGYGSSYGAGLNGGSGVGYGSGGGGGGTGNAGGPGGPGYIKISW